MSAAELSARKSNLTIGLFAACILIAVARAPVQDASDDQAASAHVQQQARQSAQADTWARVEAK